MKKIKEKKRKTIYNLQFFRSNRNFLLHEREYLLQTR